MLIAEVGLRPAPRAAPRSAAPARARLDYTIDLGPTLRLIVLDLARRDGGSGGLVVPSQPAWLARAAGRRRASGG